MANAWVSFLNVGGIVSINFLASVLRVQTSRGDLEMQRVMAAHVVVDGGVFRCDSALGVGSRVVRNLGHSTLYSSTGLDAVLEKSSGLWNLKITNWCGY